MIQQEMVVDMPVQIEVFEYGADMAMESENLDFDMGYNGGVNIPTSYNELSDKPTLDGKIIQGDMHEQDPTVPEWAKAPEKPQYSADDVGAMPVGSINALDAGDFAEMWENN